MIEPASSTATETVTNSTLETIYQRRAIKHFDRDHQLTPQELGTLLDATIQSPSAYNIQPWRFVVIDDVALRQRIRTKHGWDQPQFTDASVLILLVGQLTAWQDRPERYFADAGQPVQDIMVPMIHSFFDGKDQLQRDEVHRSLGIAMQTLMLAAKAMGYDSCPMMGFDADAVAKLIQLPSDYVMGPVVAIGRATQSAHPKPGQLPLDELVVYNCFPVSV